MPGDASNNKNSGSSPPSNSLTLFSSSATTNISSKNNASSDHSKTSSISFRTQNQSGYSDEESLLKAFQKADSTFSLRYFLS